MEEPSRACYSNSWDRLPHEDRNPPQRRRASPVVPRRALPEEGMTSDEASSLFRPLFTSDLDIRGGHVREASKRSWTSRPA